MLQMCESVCITVNVFVVKNWESTREKVRPISLYNLIIAFALCKRSTFRNFSMHAPACYVGARRCGSRQRTFAVTSIHNIFILLTRSRNIFTFTRYLRGARISRLRDDTRERRRVGTFFFFFFFLERGREKRVTRDVFCKTLTLSTWIVRLITCFWNYLCGWL